MATLPAGIRQRGATYAVSCTVKGVRRTSTAPTLDAALLTQAELRAELLRTIQGTRAGLRKDACWTLQQAFDQTAAIMWRDCASSRQLTANGKQVLDLIGPATLLQHITTEKIDALVGDLQDRGNANGTVNRKLAALSTMLTFAGKRGKLDKLPHIQYRPEAECRIRFLTPTEEQQVIGTLRLWNKADHADAVEVLIDTGLRPSELWRLEARDMDEKVLNIWKTKNTHPRSIPMTRRVKEILLRRASTLPQGKLFPYTNWWLGDVWDKVKRHLHLEQDSQFIPYALRHTCLSRLVQRGVNLKIVQVWAGHTVITTTMRYAHLSPTDLLGAVSVLEECI